MAKHEFGIMNKAPSQDENYNSYEPQKYDCISVDDDYIQPLLDSLSELKCFWHSLARPELNLTYTGTGELKELLIKAKEKNKFVIHYGL